MSYYYTFVNGVATYELGRRELAIARAKKIVEQHKKLVVEISEDGILPFMQVFYDKRIGTVVFTLSNEEKNFQYQLNEIHSKQEMARAQGISGKELNKKERELNHKFKKRCEKYRSGMLQFKARKAGCA